MVSFVSTITSIPASVFAKSRHCFRPFCLGSSVAHLLLAPGKDLAFRNRNQRVCPLGSAPPSDTTGKAPRVLPAQQRGQFAIQIMCDWNACLLASLDTCWYAGGLYKNVAEDERGWKVACWNTKWLNDPWHGPETVPSSKMFNGGTLNASETKTKRQTNYRSITFSTL